jgi:site-specific recombinase XerD
MNGAIREFLAQAGAKGCSPRTVFEAQRRLRYFREFAAKRKVVEVRDVTAELLQAYHEAMRARGLKTTSRRQYLHAVLLFLKWAHRTGCTLADVGYRVEMPKQERRLPPTPLTPDDMVRLLDLFPGRNVVDQRHRAMLELFYGCGLRREELIGMNVGDVDFGAEAVLVRHGKGRKDRLLPINEPALEALAAYLSTRGRKLAKEAALFVTKGGRRLRACNVEALFRIVRKRFPKHVHAHLLRHTFAVHLLQGGADIRYVQALLGHESPDTTGQYLGLVKHDLQRIYDAAIESLLNEWES